MKPKTKKKRQTFQQQLLLYDFASLTGERLETVLKEIEKKLLKEAKHIVGYDKCISLSDMFTKVYGIPPECVEYYKRICWFEIIKKCMRRLRSDMRAYFMFSRNNVFILKNQIEANTYKKFIQNDIVALERAAKNADKWVRNEMWREL